MSPAHLRPDTSSRCRRWRPSSGAPSGGGPGPPLRTVIARLDVVVSGGRVVRLSAAPPLAAKVLDGQDGPELLLIGAAASLVEGDRLTVALRLGTGARLTVRTAAATIAHPCPGGGGTAFDVDADLGPDARLAWLPEPLVACAGCRHRSRSRLRMAAGAQAVWSETVALGRSGEQPGDIGLRLDADLDGVPLLRDGLRLGPSAAGWDGPAVADGARHLGTVVLLGAGAADVAAPSLPRGSSPQASASGSVSVLRLAGPGVVVRAAAATGAAVERMLAPARRAFQAAVRGEAATERAAAG